jgi:hypothetical protein
MTFPAFMSVSTDDSVANDSGDHAARGRSRRTRLVLRNTLTLTQLLSY